MSAVAEAARELRAAGFRTRIRQTAGGLRFTAVRQIGAVRVLVASPSDGTPVVGAINDETMAVRGSFVDDVRHAASLGMQYAEVISR